MCEILKFNLETEGYDVDVAYSAEQAMEADLAAYSLLLLDVMMGEMSGFKMASLLRKDPRTANIPIIFLTAKDTENDLITGFSLGADDYISKPYSLREVTARVKAVLKRSEKRAVVKGAEGDMLEFETLVLDLRRVRASVDAKDISLTKKEFEILKLLLENRGRVLSRETILDLVWNNEVYVLDRTIDVNVTRLRKKIGRYGKNIVTRLGYGYCFEEDNG